MSSRFPILDGKRLQKPDMGNGRGQIDVAQPLTSDLGRDHLNTAFFTDDAAVLHPLVFTTVAFVVFRWTKYFGAEKAVPSA